MLELKLKADPTFKEKVPLPVPGRGVVEVEFEFKHRTKTELTKFITESENLNGVTYVQAVATAWEFTDEFSKKNIAMLLEEYHGAENAIATTYVKTLIGARVKNS